MLKKPKNRAQMTKTYKIIVVLILLILLIHAVHAMTLDRIIEYKEVPFYSKNVSEKINGYRIAIITDTHDLPEKELKKIVEKLNTKKLDLLVLLGDFPYTSKEPQHSMSIISGVKTVDGTYGVEGNHDYYETLFKAMIDNSMTPLSGEGLYIREGLFIAGVEDFWNRNPDIQDALDGSLEDDFVLLLAHNPDISMIQDTTGIDLILSGHTHGGQVTFFGIFAPYLNYKQSSITKYGQRFMSGWSASRDGVPVYVSNGTGGYFPRVFARPQVIIITLHNERIKQ